MSGIRASDLSAAVASHRPLAARALSSALVRTDDVAGGGGGGGGGGRADSSAAAAVAMATSDEAGRPDVRWEDVGGCEDAKQALQEMIIWPTTYPELFAQLGLDPPRGLVLYGPPGTGKTLLAKAVASQASLNFLSVSVSDLLRPEVGGSERAVAEAFRQARRCAPCILFFDEVQAMFGDREGVGEVGRKMVTQLLLETDGLAAKATGRSGAGGTGADGGDGSGGMGEGAARVIVIAATNVPEALDAAMLRAGRFEQCVYVGPPDEGGRRHILENLRGKMRWDAGGGGSKGAKGGCVGDVGDAGVVGIVGVVGEGSTVGGEAKATTVGVDVEGLVRRTELFSGADLANLAQRAALMALRKDHKAPCIRQDDFEEVRGWRAGGEGGV